MSKRLFKYSDGREIDTTTVANTVADVLDGAVSIGSSGLPLDGFIPVSKLNEVVNIGAGEEIVLPPAFYPRNITITGASIVDQTPGTATPEKMLLGETAWVNGELITGSLDIDVIMDFEAETAGTAGPETILIGKTAWVNGVQIEGTMPDNGPIDATIGFDSFLGIPSGYTTGGTITGPSLEESTPANAVEDEIAKNKTAWVNGVLISGTMETVDLVKAESYDSDIETMDGIPCLRLVADHDINICFHSGGYIDIPKPLLVEALKITPNKIANGYSICGVKGDAGFMVVKGEHVSMLEDGNDILLDFNIDNNYLTQSNIYTGGSHIITVKICFNEDLDYYGETTIVMSPTPTEAFKYFYIHHPYDRAKFAVMKYRSDYFEDLSKDIRGNKVSISTTGLGTMLGVYKVNAYYDWSIIE